MNLSRALPLPRLGLFGLPACFCCGPWFICWPSLQFCGPARGMGWGRAKPFSTEALCLTRLRHCNFSSSSSFVFIVFNFWPSWSLGHVIGSDCCWLSNCYKITESYGFMIEPAALSMLQAFLNAEGRKANLLLCLRMRIYMADIYMYRSVA